MQKSNGMNYAPGEVRPGVRKRDFRVVLSGWITTYLWMCNGLVEAGAELVGVYDPDPAKVENFRKVFSDAKASLRRRRSWKTLHSPCRECSGSLRSLRYRA